MSTKENPGPFDGLERAAPDEPVFTLRAKDPLAAKLVQEWANQRREGIIRAGSTLDDETRELELIQCREAEEISQAMIAWRAGDTAIEAKPTETYTGHAADPEELAAKLRFDTIRHAGERIHNSVAEVTDAAASLEPYGYPQIRAELVTVAGTLKSLGDEVTPKRVSYAHKVAPKEIGR